MSTATNKLIKRVKNIPWQVIDQTTLILNPKESTAHELNETGSWIWKQLEQDLAIAIIIEKMCQVFEIDSETAEKDISYFVDEMVLKGVLECQ